MYHTISCKNCQTSIPSISIYCSNCSNFVLRFHWLFYLLFFLSLSFIGFLIAELDLTFAGAIYSELILLSILGFLLRNHLNIYRSLFFYNLLPVLYIFLQHYNLFPNEISQNISFYLLAIVAAYIPIVFLIHFNWVRGLEELSIIRGISVYSFFIYIYLLLLLKLNYKLNLFNDTVYSFIEEKLHLRTILLLVTLLLLMFISFLSAIRRKIREPSNVLDNKIDIREPGLDIENNMINAVYTFIKPFLSVFYMIFNIVFNTIIEVINIMKKTIEYLMKMLYNYVLEIFSITKSLTIVLMKSIFSFTIIIIIPLIIFYFISKEIIVLVENVDLYLNEENNINFLIKIIIKGKVPV